MALLLTPFVLFSLGYLALTSGQEIQNITEVLNPGTAKACPGCGGVDCTNTTFAFGIPILQLIGGVIAGLIWAAVFIWIYVWVDQREGGGGTFGLSNREDADANLQKLSFDINSNNYDKFTSPSTFYASTKKRTL